MSAPEPIKLSQLKVYPLAERRSLSELSKILVDPKLPPPPCPATLRQEISACATAVAEARKRDASVILMYGAHLIKNGAMGIVSSLLEGGWVTHLATNGAGTI